MYKKVILFIMIMSALSTPVLALSAKSAILIDAHSGRVIKEENARERMGMASTTKIMTAFVAVTQGDLDSIVTVSSNAAGVEGSSMYLRAGDKIKLRDLVYGLMLNSGNDAATAIAEHIAGDTEGFAVMMNKQAAELGLRDTSFTNPHGLDDENHYTTAYDLAQIARRAMEEPEFAEICGTVTKTITFSGIDGTVSRTLSNHNKLLRSYKGAAGIKTGFTKKCGRCLVSAATRDSLTIIAVTLNASDDWSDHAELLDYGYTNLRYQKAFNKNDYMKSVNILGAEEVRLALVAEESVSMAVAAEDAVRVVYDVPNYIKAPVYKNQAVGSVRVYLSGELIKTVRLMAEKEVRPNAANRIKNSFGYLITELLEMTAG